MELKIERVGSELRVLPKGDLMGSSTAALREAIKETVDDATSQPARVVLDLGGLNFIDSSGIGVLMGLKAHLRTRKVEFVVQNPTPKVLQVLQLTRLDKVLGVG